MKNLKYKAQLLYPNIYLQYDNNDWDLIKTVSFLKKETKILNNDVSVPVIFNSSSLFIETLKICQYIAQSSLCLKKIACNTCNDCISFLNNQHPRAMLIDSKDTTDTVRGKLEQLKLSISGKNLYYTVIINTIENIHISAQQSLLKYLEDEKLKVYYFIITKNISIIPETILSRCQIFNITFQKEFSKYLLEHWMENKRITNKNINYSSVLCSFKLAKYSPELWYKLLNNEIITKKIEPFIKQLLNNILTKNLNNISKLLIGNDMEDSINNLQLYSLLLEDLWKLNILKECDEDYTYFKGLFSNKDLEKIVNIKMNFYLQWTNILKIIKELKLQMNLNRTIIINDFIYKVFL